MKDKDILELTEVIYNASCSVYRILLNHRRFEPPEFDRAILEAFGFLLAYLVKEQGISLDEAGSCIACFIGITFGNDRGKFYHVARSADFYLKQLLNNDGADPSIIINNLIESHPFKTTVTHQDLKEKEIEKIWEDINLYFNSYLPKMINPILEKI